MTNVALTFFSLNVRFLEGDFESYVKKMRKPHAWGGEPELLMCSHVLR
jgi:OTU domain-containing protein 6